MWQKDSQREETVFPLSLPWTAIAVESQLLPSETEAQSLEGWIRVGVGVGLEMKRQAASTRLGMVSRAERQRPSRSAWKMVGSWSRPRSRETIRQRLGQVPISWLSKLKFRVGPWNITSFKPNLLPTWVKTPLLGSAEALGNQESPQHFRCRDSVQFSHSVMSNSLQPHGLQHARLPYHQLPELAQT